jgi:putative transcriptional regulator
MAVTRIKNRKKPTEAMPGYKAVRKPPRSAARAGRSGILAAVHESISELHAAGVVGVETMREFDELCIEPVEPLGPRQISELRRREKVSQPVFARYLNVSKSSVSQWETGAKRPDGAALKLLSLVMRKGLKAIA